MPLDGDLAINVLRPGDVLHTFSDPFGFGALVHHEKHYNPNRFFSQYLNSVYFLTVPLFLQHFTSPVDSIYLSCAILKMIVQLCLIYLFSIMATGRFSIFNTDFLIAAALISSLFQTEGYNPYMGIIDQSISYVFFYALPLVFLILLFLPLYMEIIFRKSLKPGWLQVVYYPVMALITCFSGPLNTGVILIIALILLCEVAVHAVRSKNNTSLLNRQLSSSVNKRSHVWLLVSLSILSLYSLYIGTFNLSNYNNIPLAEAYARIPAGLYLHFTPKLGFPLLCLFVAFNSVFIKKWHFDDHGRKIWRFLMFMIVFTIIYIALLPLGGYRPYRPNILRYDTAIPITAGFFVVFMITTLFVLKKSNWKLKPWYIISLIGFVVLLTVNDNSRFNKNYCEKVSLLRIVAAPGDIVELNSGCTVMAWDTISKPLESEFNAQLLLYWGVTKKKTLYFQTGK